MCCFFPTSARLGVNSGELSCDRKCNVLFLMASLSCLGCLGTEKVRKVSVPRKGLKEVQVCSSQKSNRLGRVECMWLHPSVCLKIEPDSE